MSGHPVFWLFLAAVAAPLLGEIPLGFKVPIVVLEVVLGIVIGPHVLGLVQFEGFIAEMFAFGMATTLFMAGMELDFGEIGGRPLRLASGGWVLSVVLGFAAVGVLHLVPHVNAPLMVTLALSTTALGVLVPVFRDSGQLETPFGRLFVAAGTVGEIGPIVAMSLLLSERYSTWQEVGFLVIFLAIIAMAIAVGTGTRPSKVVDLLSRTMHSSSQLPVRIAILVLGGLFVLAEQFGFESIFGAFAAGMIIGVATRGSDGEPMRAKLDAVCFGWFYPFFFVGTGIKFDIVALGRNLTTMLLVPTFLGLFLVVRGASLLLYRKDIARAERLPFALSVGVASLSIIVLITEIGQRSGAMDSDVAAALIGAGLLSVMLYPTIAGVLLSSSVRPNSSSASSTGAK